jgi:hypothetical protein
MNLEPYIDGIRRQLDVAAEAGGDDAGVLATRLVAPLEAAVRLAVLDALSAATEEITLELAPGSVELRLRGRDVEFAVSPPPAEPSAEDGSEYGDPLAAEWIASETRPRAADDGDESTVSRINLRLPDRLKSRVERAAAADGLSVNAWLVRAAGAALDRNDTARRRTPHGAQHYTGWAR